MAALSRATRQIVVAHLTDRGMNPAEIASELDVSRDTVRRDLANQPEPAPPVAPESAVPAASGLLLPDGAQLRQDLDVLTAEYKGQPEGVARFVIHQAAQTVRARWQARRAAGAGASGATPVRRSV